MRSRKAGIVRRVHALPVVRYDDDKRLTSFSGLVLFSALFRAMDFSAQLRKCFAHLGHARVFGLARVVLQKGGVVSGVAHEPQGQRGLVGERATAEVVVGGAVQVVDGKREVGQGGSAEFADTGREQLREAGRG